MEPEAVPAWLREDPLQDWILLPPELHGPGYFAVDRNTVLVATRTFWLDVESLAELVRVARAQPVRLVLAPGPFREKLRRVFGPLMRRLEDTWEIRLCTGVSSSSAPPARSWSPRADASGNRSAPFAFPTAAGGPRPGPEGDSDACR